LNLQFASHAVLTLLFGLAAASASESAAVPKLSLAANDAVWDPARARFFMSVAQTDARWPSSVVIVNPETAEVEDVMRLEAEPNQLAISSDGELLYVGLDTLGIVRRYRLSTRSPELDIPVRAKPGWIQGARSLAVLRDNPRSLLLTRVADILLENSVEAVVFDDAEPRPAKVRHRIVSYSDWRSALYVRPGDGSVFAWLEGTFYALNVDATGLSMKAAVSGLVPYTAPGVFSVGLATDSWGYVVDTDSGSVAGHVAIPGFRSRCLCVPTPDAGSVIAVTTQRLERYSTRDFKLMAAMDFSIEPWGYDFNYDRLYTWGNGGVAIFLSRRPDARAGMLFLRLSTLRDVPTTAGPVPVAIETGIKRLPLAANRLLYDEARQLLYVSTPGSAGALGNSVAVVDPATAEVRESITVGSEPDSLALASGSQSLLVALQGAPSVKRIDLASMQVDGGFSTQDPVQKQGQGGPIEWDRALMLPADIASTPGDGERVVVYRAAFYDELGDIERAGSIVLYRNGVPAPEVLTHRVMIPQLGGARLYPGAAPGVLLASSNGLLEISAGESGIALRQRLAASPGALAIADGRLYSYIGAVLNPETTAIFGSVAFGGIPLPFPERNWIVYVNFNRAVAYDTRTFRPVASIQLPIAKANGPGLHLDAVRAGGDRIAVTDGEQVVIASLSAAQVWPTPDGSVTEVAPGVLRVNLPVNGIAAGPGGQLVAATPSVAGELGNSVVGLDGQTGQIVWSELAGSEPRELAVTPDRKFVYAFLAGEGRVARVELEARQRDLVFSPAYTRGDNQPAFWNMAALPDRGLAVSYDDGSAAIFDGPRLRPVVSRNDEAIRYGAKYHIVPDEKGRMLYGYNQGTGAAEIKRWGVSPEGVRGLSTAEGLARFFEAEIRYDGGLLYSSAGDVIDPERSRRVARFVAPEVNDPAGIMATLSGRLTFWRHVLVDPPSGRIYFITQGGLLVFDLRSHALLGRLYLPLEQLPASLVKWGADGLAYDTREGELYLVRISAIPLLAEPIPSPQPQLPSTPGVRIVDLHAQDLVYDPVRDRIYASTPNSEAVLGDGIIAIDPADGRIVGRLATASNPNRLTLSDDARLLHFGTGYEPGGVEALRTLDLTTGVLGPEFGRPNEPGPMAVEDLASVPGQSGSVVVVHGTYAPHVVRVYDNGIARKAGLDRTNCTSIQAGAAAGRFYCFDRSSSNYPLTRLAADANGLTNLGSSDAGLIGYANQIGFYRGRIYATNGKVVDPETFQMVGSVETEGYWNAVAFDGDIVYWLDGGTFTGDGTTLRLRSFDIATLKPVATRRINVTATNVSRLISCGNGRLAFRAGKEIYIVDP
jgi:DNA-binding beta-propeller fold protein YncE